MCVLDRDHNAAINVLRLAREPAWRATIRRPAETQPRPSPPARDGALATVSEDGRDRDSRWRGMHLFAPVLATVSEDGRDRDIIDRSSITTGDGLATVSADGRDRDYYDDTITDRGTADLPPGAGIPVTVTISGPLKLCNAQGARLA